MESAASVYTKFIFPNVDSGFDRHLSDMQKAMLDATPDCIKIISIDGNLITMNRAGCLALGVSEHSNFGMPWLSLLPAEVRGLGEDALRKAVGGQNARFPGMSVSPAGTTYWDNLLTPLIDGEGKVASILCVSRDTTEKTLLEQKLQKAIAREKFLVREMRHRVKNIFSIVAGLISISTKEAKSTIPAGDAVGILRDKLGALSRASDAVFAEETANFGNDSVDLGVVVKSVLTPYGNCCTAVGDMTTVSGEAITTFALLLHELATNAVKYGALSTCDGNVTVRWRRAGASIDLSWIEAGGPIISATPARQGFGTEMVDRMIKAIGGTVHRKWSAEGFVADFNFPIDAPA